MFDQVGEFANGDSANKEDELYSFAASKTPFVILNVSLFGGIKLFYLNLA